jgi:hypothetical protein
MRAGRAVASIVTSAGVAAAVKALPDPPVSGWRRTNFRGRQVSLTGGLAAAVGALAGAAAGGASLRLPSLVAGLSALVAGGYDDLVAPAAEVRSDKGLAGHLQALRAGRLSGGVVKVAVIGTGAVCAAACMPRQPRSLGAVLLDSALIAGSANLLNLFDLRPGRVGKIVIGAGTVSAAWGSLDGPIGAAFGATTAVLTDDLGETTMLGDLGANTLGALIGVHLAAGSNATRRLAMLTIGALTLASERVSFTKVIDSVPALRRLDELGRLPSAATATSLGR